LGTGRLAASATQSRKSAKRILRLCADQFSLNDDRSDACHNLVARHARLKKFDQMGSSTLDIAQVRISRLSPYPQ